LFEKVCDETLLRTAKRSHTISTIHSSFNSAVVEGTAFGSSSCTIKKSIMSLVFEAFNEEIKADIGYETVDPLHTMGYSAVKIESSIVNSNPFVDQGRNLCSSSSFSFHFGQNHIGYWWGLYH
jgi:hypothetical protein